MKLVASTLSLLAGMYCCGAANAVSVGTIDTFQDGTANGWSSGLNNGNGPVNVATGGPAGVADSFLSFTATGVHGPGGKLVAFGGAQWNGDYVAAGVTGISMQMNNFGATDLSMRLLFNGPNVYSANAVVLHAGSAWTSVLFSILPGALSAATALTNVTGLVLQHSPLGGGQGSGGDIAASLGVDNIAAVPEPSQWLAMMFGVAMLAAFIRPRRQAAFT